MKKTVTVEAEVDVGDDHVQDLITGLEKQIKSLERKLQRRDKKIDDLERHIRQQEAKYSSITSAYDTIKQSVRDIFDLVDDDHVYSKSICGSYENY